MTAQAKKKSRPSSTARRSSKAKTHGPEATLKLDAQIYKKAALVQAQNAFADLASIRIKKEGRHQVVKFSEIKADLAEQLPDEFANYALGCLVVSG